VIATDVRARDLLIETGTPAETATAFVELIAVGRDAAVTQIEELHHKMEAMADRVTALADERDAAVERAAALQLQVSGKQERIDALEADLRDACTLLEEATEDDPPNRPIVMRTRALRALVGAP
jgi:hypothetical protein